MNFVSLENIFHCRFIYEKVIREKQCYLNSRQSRAIMIHFPSIYAMSLNLFVAFDVSLSAISFRRKLRDLLSSSRELTGVRTCLTCWDDKVALERHFMGGKNFKVLNQ